MAMDAHHDHSRIYDGGGDRLMEGLDLGERIILLPDRAASRRPDPDTRLRIMWGHWLLEDLLAFRYRSLVCAVNAQDNSRGIIAQVAELLPTSQWTKAAITEYTRHLVQPHTVSVVKFDMDAVEVLALLRPAEHDHLTLDDLSLGFKLVAEMLVRRPQRMPSASVCFLGAHTNRLCGPDGVEPSFETVLRTMYQGGYRGDVYPAPWMWESAPTGVFASYPFPSSLERMRDGGY
jgi:hypothetical protein